MTTRIIKHEGMALMDKEELRTAIMQEEKERRLAEMITEMISARPKKKNAFSNNGGRKSGSSKVSSSGHNTKVPALFLPRIA